MMFWELLASHDRLTVCAAAKAGKNKKERKETNLATDFDHGVRELTVPPLLPVLAHGGGLKSHCTAIPVRDLHGGQSNVRRRSSFSSSPPNPNRSRKYMRAHD